MDVSPSVVLTAIIFLVSSFGSLVWIIWLGQCKRIDENKAKNEKLEKKLDDTVGKIFIKIDKLSENISNWRLDATAQQTAFVTDIECRERRKECNHGKAS